MMDAFCCAGKDRNFMKSRRNPWRLPDLFLSNPGNSRGNVIKLSTKSSGERSRRLLAVESYKQQMNNFQPAFFVFHMPLFFQRCSS